MPKSLKEYTQNAPERKEYAIALLKLEPVLYGLPAKIISIDGEALAGKTTLGRYLAWRFNISLLETDLFLHENTGELKYRQEDVKAVIQSRMVSERPIIVEGIVSLRLLAELDLEYDFHIRVNCNDAPKREWMDKLWREYTSKFEPMISKSLFLNLPADHELR